MSLCVISRNDGQSRSSRERISVGRKRRRQGLNNRRRSPHDAGRRAHARRALVSRRLTACGATAARSAARSSSFARRNNPSCGRRPRRPTTSRCGVSPRSRAISSRPSARRRIRCRIPTSVRSSLPAPTRIVRFYLRGLLIKTHPRRPPGGQSIDAQDCPVERSTHAFRNVDPNVRQLEPRCRLVAAIGGHSSGRLTPGDGQTEIP